MHMRTLIAALLLSLPALADGAKVKEKAAETVDATKDYASEKKDEFVARMDAKMKALKDDLAKLKDKTKDKADATVTELEARQKKADAKFGEVKKAGGKAWANLKGGVESAVDELQQGVESAKSR